MTTYLVLGATGQQGGATARALRDMGQNVRTLVRSPEGRAAAKLAAIDCQLVAGDYDDPSSLVAAMQGVDGAFLAQPLQDPATEVCQASAVISAAQAAGCQQLIYSAALDASEHTGVVHFDSKHRIIEMLANSGLRYTVLGPGGFMENLLFDDAWRSICQGSLISPFNLDVVQALVSVRDIGRMAASVLVSPATPSGQFLPVYADALDARGQAAVIAKQLGHEVTAERLPDELTRRYMGEDLAGMFAFFNHRAVTVLPEAAEFRRRVPDAMTLRDWLKSSATAR